MTFSYREWFALHIFFWKRKIHFTRSPDSVCIISHHCRFSFQHLCATLSIGARQFLSPTMHILLPIYAYIALIPLTVALVILLLLRIVLRKVVICKSDERLDGKTVIITGKTIVNSVLDKLLLYCCCRLCSGKISVFAVFFTPNELLVKIREG